MTHERHQNLYEEKKEKKWDYDHERYRNLPELEKQRLVKYGKNITKCGKILRSNPQTYKKD